MSRQQYEKKADKTLNNLVTMSESKTNDDIITALEKAIEVLGRDYASIQ